MSSFSSITFFLYFPLYTYIYICMDLSQLCYNRNRADNWMPVMLTRNLKYILSYDYHYKF